MPKYEFDGYEGVHEGATPEEAWANLLASLPPEENSVADSVKRGTGLAVRGTAFAPAKLATSLGDMVATGVNKFANVVRPDYMDALPPTEILPTGNREYLESKLDEFLPTPTGLAERALDMGGEAAFTGGPLGYALGQVKNLPAVAAPVADMVFGRGRMLTRALGPKTVPAATSTRPVPSTMAPAQRKLAAGKINAPDATASSVVSGGERQIGAGSLGDMMAETFVTRPALANVSEFTGGAGLSLMADAAAETDAHPAVKALMGVAGGIGGGMVPQVAASRMGQISRLASRVIDPITGNVSAPDVASRVQGGQGRRAAVELQSRADDPTQAARDALNAPPGVTPARATGDPELMALERTVLDQDLHRSGRVATDLANAEERTIQELLDVPEGVSRQQWQQQVVQRATPEGAAIEVADPDTMLRQSQRAFDTSYDEIRGFPMGLRVMRTEGGDIPMMEHVAGAVNTTGIVNKAKWRTSTAKDLTELFTDMVRASDDGMVDSADLLRYRSALRAEVRIRRNPDKPRARAEKRMYQEAERRVTEVLESQLPEDAAGQLRAVDARYRDYKTVEDAVLKSGEKGLTPEALRRSISQRGNRGVVARGEAGDLADLAERGKEVRKLFRGKENTDDQIRRTFRTMDDETARRARGDVTREIVDQARRLDTGEGGTRLSGTNLRKAIETNASRLRAAGFADDDIGRLDQIAQRLVTVQRPSVQTARPLVDDHLGFLTRMAAGMIGAKATSKITRALGTGGTGSLIFGGIVRRGAQETFQEIGVSGAEQLLSDAVTDPELFAALLTRSTAPAVEQMRANRIINAWLAQTGNVFDEPEE